MREMKDSGVEWIGEIPKDWKIIKLKYCISIQNGSDPKTDGDIPVYGSGDKSFKTCGEYKIGPTVLIGRKGATLHIPHFIEGKYWNVDTAFNTVANEEILIRFFYYLAICFDYKYYISQTTLPSMTQSSYENILIPLPDKKIQKDIVCCLDEKCSEIDSLTSDIENQIETLEQYKKSVITEAVTKGLDPDAEMKDSGVEWIGKIPEDWEVTKIDTLYNIRNEKVSDKDYPPLSVTMKGIVPQLETAAKTNDGDNRKLVRKGDFAINSRSDRRGSCGISEYDGSVSLINTVLCPKSNMHPGYYNWLFHSPLFSDEFYRWGHGIVDDLWTTNWQDMKKIMLPVPPLSEQTLISNFLNNKCSGIDSIIADKQSQLDALAEYKKSLIYEYVTGKKEVPSA